MASETRLHLSFSRWLHDPRTRAPANAPSCPLHRFHRTLSLCSLSPRRVLMQRTLAWVLFVVGEPPAGGDGPALRDFCAAVMASGFFRIPQFGCARLLASSGVEGRLTHSLATSLNLGIPLHPGTRCSRRYRRRRSSRATCPSSAASSSPSTARTSRPCSRSAALPSTHHLIGGRFTHASSRQ